MDANHFMGLSKDEVVSVCIFRAGVLFGFFSSLFCIAGVFLTYTVSSRPLRITRTLGSVVYYNFFHVSVYKGSEDLL